jgi:similar to stage IV sporulation protein
MLLLRLWNYLRGYVIIFVEGYFLEKFINICAHRQIYLWDIKRQNNCVMVLKVSIRGFKMIKPVAQKSRCRVRIMKKKGLPFVFNRYRRRKTFLVGAVFFLVSFYVLTSFIWAIEVTGNKKLEKSYIEAQLASMGVKPGVLKFNINTGKVVNEMMLYNDDLSWISVTIKGTKVKVRMEERTKPPALVDKNEPCNIVALKDGVIKSIIVKDGQEMVKVGDTVTKGQILISGSIAIKNEEERTRLVHAIGTVKARTWYEDEHPVNTTISENVRTGNKKDNYSIVLFSKRINFFHSEVNFENYDKIEIVKRLAVGNDLVLPLGFVVERYYEHNIIDKTISLEDAKKIAANEAYKKTVESIPEDAEKVKTNLNIVKKDNGDMVAKVTVECLEDIGFAEKIGG